MSLRCLGVLTVIFLSHFIVISYDGNSAQSQSLVQIKKQDHEHENLWTIDFRLNGKAKNGSSVYCLLNVQIDLVILLFY